MRISNCRSEPGGKGKGRIMMEQQSAAAEQELEEDLLHQFEQILHDDPIIDEVGFLHPTHFQSLDLCNQTTNSTPQLSEFHHYYWCRDHKLAISSHILPKLYHAARHAYSNARTAPSDLSSAADLMRHSKALLIISPDFLTAWNSRKTALSVMGYDFTKLRDELQLCALILSYSPKNESTWSHRRWVIRKVAEQNQDVSEFIEKESILVKEIAEKSKMNYRAWRHRCWLIPYMERKQLLDELNKSARWNEFHVADNCCFHYRRSLLIALLDNHDAESREDSLNWQSANDQLFKEELRWNEMLIRRYQGRECWVQHLISSETCQSTESLVDVFLDQEIFLVLDCLNAPADEFGEARTQAELAALYILWIAKQVPAMKQRLGEKLHSVGNLELKDMLAKACPEKSRLWTNLLT